MEISFGNFKNIVVSIILNSALFFRELLLQSSTRITSSALNQSVTTTILRYSGIQAYICTVYITGWTILTQPGKCSAIYRSSSDSVNIRLTKSGTSPQRLNFALTLSLPRERRVSILKISSWWRELLGRKFGREMLFLRVS